MKKIIKKGNFGYLQNRRIYTGLRTLLFFALSLGLYGMGYWSTGTNQNLLTIVAILGCLPACKSAVNFIIFLRASGCSETLHARLIDFDNNEGLQTFYDLYFTSYQKNYPISHMTLRGNVLCGITESTKCDCNGAEKHLEQMLSQEGIKNVTVKIFSQTGKYIDRLSQLEALETSEHKNQDEIISLLYSISL